MLGLAHAGHGAAPGGSLVHLLSDHGLGLALLALVVLLVVLSARNAEVK